MVSCASRICTAARVFSLGANISAPFTVYTKRVPSKRRVIRWLIAAWLDLLLELVSGLPFATTWYLKSARNQSRGYKSSAMARGWWRYCCDAVASPPRLPVAASYVSSSSRWHPNSRAAVVAYLRVCDLGVLLLQKFPPLQTWRGKQLCRRCRQW